ALAELFAAASSPKRSKIGSFLRLVHALDGRLRFPAAIPERAGLALSQALDADPGLGPRLAAALEADPPQSPEAEARLIERIRRTPPPAPAEAEAPSPAPSPEPPPA